MKDIKSDLEYYQSQWEKALEDGVFEDAPKAPACSSPGWFGVDNFPESDIEDSDAENWKQITDMNGETLLSEESEASEKQIKKNASKMANLHNPVYPNTLGNDQDIEVTQNWGLGGKEIQELEEMKVKLEQLESRLNAEEAMGKQGKGISEQIKNLKKQIDDLSNSLNGNRYDRQVSE